MFQATYLPILRSTFWLVGSRGGALYQNCIYNQKVILRMGEFFTQNMLGWFKKINKQKKLLQLVGCLHRCKLLSLCMKMPGIIHSTGQLFMAVHLIGYQSVHILCSVFSLSLHPWEAPGWQVMALGAAVKQVISSWLQKVDSNVFTLEYKPWYHCGANAKMVVVTMLRSDVYHLLHMCHVLIEVPITFWHESVCYLIFLSSFYVHCSLIRWFHKYWVFWMVQFLCHFLIIFTCITCSSSDFHPAMPTQYCNLPYISVIY